MAHRDVAASAGNGACSRGSDVGGERGGRDLAAGEGAVGDGDGEVFCEGRRSFFFARPHGVETTVAARFSASGHRCLFFWGRARGVQTAARREAEGAVDLQEGVDVDRCGKKPGI